MAYPSSGYSYPPKPARPLWPRLLKRLLLLILLLPFLGLAFLAATSRSFRDVIAVIVEGGLSPEVSFPGQSHVDLLLVGRDIDVDNGKHVLRSKGRSDLMMLIRVDFEHRSAYVLSIPRDTWIRLPGSRRHAKINAANAIGGAHYAARAVAALTGVHPEYMLTLDYHGFVRAIDAMGGVPITVDRNMDYDDNWGDLHVHLRKGEQVLNGRQALGFVRFRHADSGASDSDFKRTERQQRMLAALKMKLKDPLTWPRLPYVCDAVRPSLSSNLTFGQLVCVAAFMPRVPPANLHMVTMPAFSSGAVVYPEPTRMRAVLRRYFQAAR